MNAQVAAASGPGEAHLYLLCRAGAWFCALPVEHVLETMRPLPVESITGAPGFVSGVAVIRGSATPVVDVQQLLGGSTRAPTRFVTVRGGAGAVALSFDDVLGVRALAASPAEPMPRLLNEVGAGVVSAMRTLDAELLLVLEGARTVPSGVWKSLDARTESA